MRDGLKLPECKCLGDMTRSDDPNFCPYHRILGHTIEDCYVFKDWIEKKYRDGEIELPQSSLQDPAPHG